MPMVMTTTIDDNLGTLGCSSEVSEILSSILPQMSSKDVIVEDDLEIQEIHSGMLFSIDYLLF